MKDSKRDSFASSFGMIVALAGSAVGLGNMWRFPYLVGDNGGAAFIIIYLAFAILFSLPIMLCELTIGRRSQANAVSAFTKLSPGSNWRTAGFLGVLAAFVVLTFYIVIGGWSVDYLFRSCLFQFRQDADFSGMFEISTTSVWRPMVFMVIFMLATAIIVRSGIKDGIEKCSKVMMPVLFLIIIILAVYSMLLPGAKAGIDYIFKPDFSQVSGQTFIAAMGQTFFSLSLGMGIMITYASYMGKSENLMKSSVLTITSDTAFALIASCAIMPAVFALGGSPDKGPGLVFLTLPNLFAQMKTGGIVAILFFASFLLAAITSSISIFEVIIAYVVENTRLTRVKATVLMSSVLIALGAVNSLSQGVLSDVKVFGMTILDFCDYVSANFIMTVCALLTVLFVGWKLGKANFKDEITNGGTLAVSGRFIDIIFFIIKYIAPPVILAIIVFSQL